MRDSRTGYLVPAHGTPGVLPNGQSCWDAVVAARHLEIQVDIQARELYLEFVLMDLDSDETSRDIDAAVLHRISIRIIWAEWFGLGTHF